MKAKLKEKVVSGDVPNKIEGGMPEGMKASDLSVEKRMELYGQEVARFDKEMSETYGVSLGVELKFSPKGIIPTMVLVDLLSKKNVKNSEATQKEPAK